MRTFFWLSLIFVIYTYAGYPIILWIWAALRKQNTDKKYIQPFVSIIIAAYNEEKFIGRKLTNCLQLEYPKDKLEVIVVCDGSDDDTEGIINIFHPQGVRCYSHAERKGKATALNLGVSKCRGDVLFFTDARQILDKAALRELVANFSDPRVGSVSGELILIPGDKNGSSEGIALYWNLEKWMRRKESEIYSMLGATGAIYALRKSLFTTIPSGTILDDMLIPLKGVLRGYRAIFDGSAKAYDAFAKDSTEEARRKIRTLSGNFQLMKLEPRLLIPFINPVFFQFICHKIFRLLVPFAMALCFLANSSLSESSYRIVFVGQILFYLMAILAPWAPENYFGRIMKFAHMIVEMNICVVRGFFRFVMDSQLCTWEKAKL